MGAATVAAALGAVAAPVGDGEVPVAPGSVDLGVAGPPTSATRPPEPPPAAVDLPPRHELLGQVALDGLAIDLQREVPGWTVVFLPGRDGLRGLTLPDQRRVEVYVRESDDVGGVARVLAHELGHVLDISRNDPADRQAWRDARGLGPGVPWWPEGTTYDFDTGSGDFAEAFATCAAGSSSVSAFGPVTVEQLELLGSLVGRRCG